MELERLTPLFARQVIYGEKMTVARVHLGKGAIVPEHRHANEQMTMLERGRLRFRIGPETVELEAGQTLHIPPDVPHLVEALEDSIATDVFAPSREDWRLGDDAYLRK
jgi:quercetin dioxygenase-like cupin family protein